MRSMSKREFQTEVSQLLQLIIHSLYSHPEIFLRELISNSSDALDKLRHLTLTDETFKSLPFNPRIDLELDEANNTLSIADTGIGMDEDDLVSHLGTIARSGTKNFLCPALRRRQERFQPHRPVRRRLLQRLHGRRQDRSHLPQSRPGSNLPLDQRRQDRLRHRARHRRRARAEAGTTVLLHLNEEGKQYTSSWRLQEVVKKYSNHIAFPIFLTYDKSEWNAEEKKSDKIRTTEQVNAASALWRRSKSELSDDDYKELYKSLTGDSTDPLFWFHTRAEGTHEYITLFYVPAHAPLDLYQADYKAGVKLYVKRVFIMDDSKDLLPQYLRFVRGIIDSEDLPLNVSREILQQNRVLTSIRTASVKKILSEFKSVAEKQPEKYLEFIQQYNRPLKEGLYSDYANRETLLDLIRVKTTKAEGLSSLADVKSRMEPEQKSIYYITGGAESLLRTSPLLEIYKKKNIEVLILDDDFDEIVFAGIDKYGDIELKSVNKASTSEDLKNDAEPEEPKPSSLCSTSSKPSSATASKTSAPPSASPTAPPASSPTKKNPRSRCSRCSAPWGRRDCPPPNPPSRSTPITRSSKSSSPAPRTPPPKTPPGCSSTRPC